FHNTATSLVMTGNSPLSDVLAFTPSENDFPHLGAQLALKQTGVPEVPAAVSLPDPVSDGPYTTPGQNGGFLGARYAPFRVYGDPNDERFVVDGLAPGAGLLPDRLHERRTLLSTINGQQSALEAGAQVAELEGYQRRAFALLASD